MNTPLDVNYDESFLKKSNVIQLENALIKEKPLLKL